jgi:hypothetical protein
MPDRTFRPKESSALLAAREQAYLTAIHVLLWKDTIIVDESTPLATIIAAECDFDGYARTVLPATLPLLASLGSTAYLILSSTMAEFAFSGPSTPPVVNSAAGMAILQETAVGPPAVFALYNATVFDAPIPMGKVGDIILKVLSQVIGN